MNVPLFISCLFILQIICFFIGKKASRNIQSQEDYFLAGRKIGFFPLLMTLIATQIGGGLILGSAEEAYLYGWSVLLYPVGACLGLLLLSCGIGKKMSQYGVSTVAQLFEVIYQSSKLKKVASLLSILSLFMILIGQVVASKKFMLSLGVNENILFFCFWGIVILYTVLGGFKAVVATDIFQAVFFILVFLACFTFSIMSDMPQATTAALTQNFQFDSAKFTGWLLMPLLFMVIEQDMAQRCFAAKSARSVSLASACAAICILLVCAIPVYYGILARTLGLEIIPDSSIFMTAIQATTTPAIVALVGCAILAAIISTADSLINAISSNIAQDFDFKKWPIRSSQIISGIIGCTALLCSVYCNSIVGILIQSYELSVSCLFIPIIIGIFIKKGSPTAAFYSVIFGGIGFVLFRLFPLDFIPREIASLAISSLGYGIGWASQLEVFARRKSAT